MDQSNCSPRDGGRITHDDDGHLLVNQQVTSSPLMRHRHPTPDGVHRDDIDLESLDEFEHPKAAFVAGPAGETDVYPVVVIERDDCGVEQLLA